MHGASFQDRLLWIFGSPRSGSTWLLQMLSEHEAVVPIDEPLIGLYLGPFTCDLPGGRASDLDVSDFTIRRVQRHTWSQFFAEQFSEIWRPALSRMMTERFYAQALQYHSRVPVWDRMVAIKEPNGSQSADVLMQALPHARLLFLLRDGRDVVDSELAGNLKNAWVSREFAGLSGIDDENRLQFVTHSAHKWLWRTQVVQEAMRSHPGPTLTMRYEDLVASPTTELRRIFGWLGLPATLTQVNDWVERNRFDSLSGGQTGPAEFFRAAQPGAWRRNLRPEERAAVTAVLAKKLAELGYDESEAGLPGPGDALDPSGPRGANG